MSAASDSFGHTLTYAWTSTCTGGLPPGTFDDASLAAATWTAPLNATGASQTCALKVTVSDGHGFSRTGTHTATVVSVPRVLFAAGAGGGRRDGGDHRLEPDRGQRRDLQRAGDGDADGGDGHDRDGHVPAGARTGVLSVTTPAGVGASAAIFKVLPKIDGLHAAERRGGERRRSSIVTGTNLRAVTGVARRSRSARSTVPAGAITCRARRRSSSSRVPLGAVTGEDQRDDGGRHGAERERT